MLERNFKNLKIIYPEEEENRLELDFLLASYFVKEYPNSYNVLDIGTGVGFKAIYIKSCIKNCSVVGMDMKRDLIRIAIKNVEENLGDGSIDLFFSDLKYPPPRVAAGTFPFIVTTIPTLEDIEILNLTIDQWIKFCLLMLQPEGTVLFLCPVDLLHNFFFSTFQKIGDIKIIPIWDDSNTSSFVIIRAVKGGSQKISLTFGLEFES